MIFSIISAVCPESVERLVQGFPIDEFRRCGCLLQISTIAQHALEVIAGTVLGDLSLRHAWRIGQPVFAKSVPICARHDNATTFRVAVQQAENTVMLVVEDNGGGFDPAMMRGAKHSAGLGIITMRELAEFSGGTFNIPSDPCKGTTIRVEIGF